LAGITVTSGYDNLLRRTSVTLKNGQNPLFSTGCMYDGVSRLRAVSDGVNTASYIYLPNSSLVSQNFPVR
jgi:hypothetical protein